MPPPEPLIQRVQHSIVVVDFRGKEARRLGLPDEHFSLRSRYSDPEGNIFMAETVLPKDCLMWDAPSQPVFTNVGGGLTAITMPMHYPMLWQWLVLAAVGHQENIMRAMFYGRQNVW